MKKYNFVHALTPPNLKDINVQIAALLEQESPDEKQLLELAEHRDTAIADILESLENADRKAFAEAEYRVNQIIAEATKALYSDSLSQLSGLLRGQKAVAKYK